jgi:2-polyprenyl-6-methoxyphenol hydroxylase-like FAD-dependent oxidoreductase
MLRNVIRSVSKVGSRIRSTSNLFVIKSSKQVKQKYSTINTANDTEVLEPPKNASAEDLEKWMKSRPIAKNRKVLIVGTDIGAFTLALSLKAKGIKPDFIDPKGDYLSFFEEKGTVISVNTAKVLDDLGLFSEVERFSAPIDGWYRMDSQGNPFGDINYNHFTMIHKYRTYGVELRKLYQFLEAKLAEGPNPITIKKGVSLVKAERKIAERKNMPIKPILETFLSNGEMKYYDVVVAADGPHSQVRQLLVDPKKFLIFPYCGRWNIIINRPPTVPAGLAFEMWGNGKRVGVHPVADDKLYVWGTYRIPNDKSEYHRRTIATQFISHYNDFGGYFPAIAEEMQKKVNCIEDKIFDVRGAMIANNTVIIGEAAHSIVPVFNGQNLAISAEDGRILGEVLSLARLSVPQAQNAYSFVRRPRVQIIQKESTKWGLIAQRTLTPFRYKLRDFMLRWSSSSSAMSKLEHRMLGYDKALLKELAKTPTRQ